MGMQKRKYATFRGYRESGGSATVTEDGVRAFLVGKAGEDSEARRALLADPRGVPISASTTAMDAGERNPHAGRRSTERESAGRPARGERTAGVRRVVLPRKMDGAEGGI